MTPHKSAPKKSSRGGWFFFVYYTVCRRCTFLFFISDLRLVTLLKQEFTCQLFETSPVLPLLCVQTLVNYRPKHCNSAAIYFLHCKLLEQTRHSIECRLFASHLQLQHKIRLCLFTMNTQHFQASSILAIASYKSQPFLCPVRK